MKEEGGNVSPQESQHFLMCFLCFRNLFIFYQELTSFPLKLQWFRLTSQHGEKSVCWFVSCLFCWHKTDPAGKHPDLNSCWEPSIFFFKNSLSQFFLFVQLASQERAICTLHKPFFFLLKDRCNNFTFRTILKFFQCSVYCPREGRGGKIHFPNLHPRTVLLF